MLKKQLEITNKLGLHARAAAKLVAIAGHYASNVEISHNEKTVNGKSIMGVMMLAAHQGTKIEVIVSGPDEKTAIDHIEQLVTDKFGEEA